jgi:hypothetical protein
MARRCAIHLAGLAAALRLAALLPFLQVFKRHGAVSIDTPVFELKETLTGARLQPGPCPWRVPWLSLRNQ